MSTESEWKEPLPITDSDSESEVRYPIDVLPPLLKDAILEAQKITEAPLPLVAAGAWSVLSLAVQGQVSIERAPGITYPASLFLLTLGKSGERKSTVDKLFMTPVYEYMRKHSKEWADILGKFNGEFAAWTSKVEGVKGSIKAAQRATKKDKTNGN